MKNFQAIKLKILTVVSELLKKHELQIYEINNFKDYGDDVLQILVEDAIETNRALDFDNLVIVNEEISELLDQIEEIKDPYLLEVASAGIEKAIRSKKELEKAINHYVHLEFKDEVANQTMLEGILKSFDSANQKFRIEYFVKGQSKHFVFEWEMIKAARYAVKF